MSSFKKSASAAKTVAMEVMQCEANKASSACLPGMGPVCIAKGGKCGWSRRIRMPAKSF